MNKTEMQQAYLDYINKYCNQNFELGNLPGGVKIALDRLMQLHEELPPGVASVQVADISVSYFPGGSDSGMPKTVQTLLYPYRRPKFI